MQKSTKAKLAAGAAATLVAAGLAVSGSSLTSAYFSHTASGGQVTASHGSIELTVNGGTKTPEIGFKNILPGETRTGSFKVKNVGRSAQDLWLQFTDQKTVDHINTLGRYAAIEIKYGEKTVFYSNNLNDKYPGVLTPLPKELKLAENVAPGTEETVTFSFEVASAFKTQVSDALMEMIPELADIAKMKLPYSVTATQPGIAPGAEGGFAGQK